MRSAVRKGDDNEEELERKDEEVVEKEEEEVEKAIRDDIDIDEE